MARYKTFTRSGKTGKPLSKPKTVDSGLTRDEAMRACKSYNASRTQQQVNRNHMMEFISE